MLSGFAWVLILLPLAARALGQDHDSLRRYLIPGMAAGLALCALVVVWERIAFPGIMDFASEYRATGSFSDMHTGGAALDGYVILALSFGAVWALAARKPAVIAAAALNFVLGTYAMLVTFTRSTYVAFALVLVIVLFFSLQRVRPGRTMDVARAVLALLVFAVMSYATGTRVRDRRLSDARCGAGRLRRRVLPWSGRSALGGAGQRRVPRRARVSLVMAALTAWVTRGVYVGYGGALALFGVGVLCYWSGRAATGITLAVACLPLLALGALLVAWYWGRHRRAPRCNVSRSPSSCA